FRVSAPEVWQQLLVDDRPLYEIAKANGEAVGYQPSHVYTATVRGEGRPLKLQLADAKGSSADNHGAFEARICGPGGACDDGAAAPVQPLDLQAPPRAYAPPPSYTPPPSYLPPPGYTPPPSYPSATKTVTTYKPRWGLFAAG